MTCSSAARSRRISELEQPRKHSGLVIRSSHDLVAEGHGPVAQRLEQGTHNPLVPGSNPGGPSPERFRGCHAVIPRPRDERGRSFNLQCQLAKRLPLGRPANEQFLLSPTRRLWAQRPRLEVTMPLMPVALSNFNLQTALCIFARTHVSDAGARLTRVFFCFCHVSSFAVTH